ncbi:hypothetical protein, partial [Streptomyces brasiliscabiei]|uniref:hypothetical protein n=1 Tax=Streptomyces brasiliscabiei TaxID=2736302 RepID=UPI001C0FE484
RNLRCYLQNEALNECPDLRVCCSPVASRMRVYSLIKMTARSEVTKSFQVLVNLIIARRQVHISWQASP